MKILLNILLIDFQPPPLLFLSPHPPYLFTAPQTQGSNFLESNKRDSQDYLIALNRPNRPAIYLRPKRWREERMVVVNGEYWRVRNCIITHVHLLHCYCPHRRSGTRPEKYNHHPLNTCWATRIIHPSTHLDLLRLLPQLPHCVYMSFIIYSDRVCASYPETRRT